MAVRGVLCNKCNLRMSVVDDALWMEQAQAYKALPFAYRKRLEDLG